MMGKRKTYVGIVLDRSGSMYNIRQATINAFNTQIEEIRRRVSDQSVLISHWQFANVSRLIFLHEDVVQVQPLTLYNYQPSGSTALFDGLTDCIDAFSGVSDANDPEVAFLVVTITDGVENNSKDDNVLRAPRLLLDRQKTDRWTFAFQLPPGHKDKFVGKYGVPDDNVMEWSGDVRGVRLATDANTNAFDAYFKARRGGHTHVSSFYVETDLSKLSTEEIRQKLTDISSQYKKYAVDKETRIDEFVASKTSKPYLVGSGFYQLTKREIIQRAKSVLIMEKGQRAVWGGVEARHLIGLPDGADAKVNPGNHSNYDIFVQTKAPNRKLVRGTHVLVDLTKAVPDTPTWDYENAYREAEEKRKAAAATAVPASIA